MRRALGDRSLERVPPHLTLVPPVNVRSDQLSQGLAVVRAAAAATTGPLTVTLGPPTSFLPANPVLYLPVGGDAAGITALRSRVWAPPLTRALTWPFVAHVTLADDAPPERIEAAVAALADYRVTVVFDRLHLLVERRAGPAASLGTSRASRPVGPSAALDRSYPRWQPLADACFGPPSIVARGGPLAVELVRSRMVDPEGAALLAVEGADLSLPDQVLRGPLVITARREGEVVGVAAGWLDPDGERRTSVFVAPVHRGQGIGRHLENALASAEEDAAAEEGWDRGHPA